MNLTADQSNLIEACPYAPCKRTVLCLTLYVCYFACTSNGLHSEHPLQILHLCRCGRIAASTMLTAATSGRSVSRQRMPLMPTGPQHGCPCRPHPPCPPPCYPRRRPSLAASGSVMLQVSREFSCMICGSSLCSSDASSLCGRLNRALVRQQSPARSNFQLASCDNQVHNGQQRK